MEFANYNPGDEITFEHFQYVLQNEKRLTHSRDLTSSLIKELGDQKAFEFLLKIFNSLDTATRLDANMGLLILRTDQAVDLLISATTDKDSVIRENAIRTLGYIGNPRAVKALIAALKDDISDIRSSAARALKNFKSLEAIEPLIEALSDEDFYVKSYAISSLGDLGDRRAVPPLFTAFENFKDDELRADILFALGALKDKKGYDLLVKMLDNESREIRSAAVGSLGDYGASEVGELLIKALDDRDAGVRSAAISALGDLNFAGAIEPLKRFLSDEVHANRHNAGLALAKLGYKLSKAEQEKVSQEDETSDLEYRKDVERLTLDLQNEDENTRLMAHIFLFSRFGVYNSDGVDRIPLLIKALKDPSSSIRNTAAANLGDINDTRSVLPLIEMLNDENEWVKLQTIKSLGKMGDDRAVLPLIDLLKDKNPTIKYFTIQALVDIGNNKALEPLFWVEQNDDGIYHVIPGITPGREGKKLKETARIAIEQIKSKEEKGNTPT